MPADELDNLKWDKQTRMLRDSFEDGLLTPELLGRHLLMLSERIDSLCDWIKSIEERLTCPPM